MHVLQRTFIVAAIDARCGVTNLVGVERRMERIPAEVVC
jgi:hypothetical protein